MHASEDIRETTPQKLRRRGGIKVQAQAFRRPPYRRDVGASLWTLLGEVLTIPSTVEASRVRLIVAHCQDGVYYLRQYRCEPRVSTDGYIHVGPDTLEEFYNLRLGFHDRHAPGYLNVKHHPLAVKAAARLSRGLEAVTQGQAYPASVPSIPEPLYGFDHLLPMEAGDGLKASARGRFKLPPFTEPTREQLLETWDTVARPYIQDGKSFFLYPARYVVHRPGNYAAHPRSGEAPPEVAPERDGVKHRDWVGRDGRWLPAIQPGATVWFDGRTVSGHEYPNPAIDVLCEAGLFERTPEEFMADAAACVAELEEKLVDLDTDRLDVLVDAVRERLRPGVLFVVNDIHSALLRPDLPIVASAEPLVTVFQVKHLVHVGNGWDLDLASVPRRFQHIVAARP